MKIPQQFLEFVARHAHDEVNALRLKFSDKNIEGFGNLDLDFALTQIRARDKARKKIPGFIENQLFMFPSLVASEQATNETVAKFHATLIANTSSLFDMTAGLGIDDMTFAKSNIKVVSCEIDETKCEWLRHNSEIFKVDNNLEIVCNDSIEELKKNNLRYDVIYADPARRNLAGNRIHALEDCIPDIKGNLSMIMDHTDRLIIKCSPLLDISFIINTVEKLFHIYVVCFRGECKELLIEIHNEGEFTGVTAIDLDWDRTISEFKCLTKNLENTRFSKYATLNSPSDYSYLYEPNAAVMKTGDWHTLCQKFPDLWKADVNTHLFLSNTLYKDFPGRKLKMSASIGKKDLKSLKNTKFNIVARNHPLTAPKIYNLHSIIPGGKEYIYAFRYKSAPMMIRASEI